MNRLSVRRSDLPERRRLDLLDVRGESRLRLSSSSRLELSRRARPRSKQGDAGIPTSSVAIQADEAMNQSQPVAAFANLVDVALVASRRLLRLIRRSCRIQRVEVPFEFEALVQTNPQAEWASCSPDVWFIAVSIRHDQIAFLTDKSHVHKEPFTGRSIGQHKVDAAILLGPSSIHVARPLCKCRIRRRHAPR